MRPTVILLITALAPLPAQAYRPFETTDGSVAAPWQITIEAAPAALCYRLRNRSTMSAPAMVIALGLPFDIELSVGGALNIEHAQTLERGAERVRLADNAVTFKKVLLNGALNDLRLSGPSVGFELTLLLPATDSDESSGVSGVAALSHVWPRLLAFHLNVAGGLSRAHRGFLFGGIAVEGPWSWLVRPVVEATVRYDDGLSGLQRSFGFGAILPVNINLWFDAAGRLRHDASGEQTFEITAGVNWSFPDAGFF